MKAEYRLFSLFIFQLRLLNKIYHLQIVDCASGDMISDIEAHEGSVWSLNLHPDGKGLASGGADKIVKFWEFGVG